MVTWQSFRGILRILFASRRLLFSIGLFCSAAVLFLAHETYVTSVEFQFYNVHFENYVRNKPATTYCKIPDYDPFDGSILKYITKWSSVKCGKPQPYLTYVDHDGFIHINETGANKSGYKLTKIDCIYQEIIRPANDDNVVNYSIPQIFSAPEKLPSDYVIVKCYTKANKLIYESGHAHVPPPSKELLQNNEKLKEGRPSVLILGFDSMSRLNFIRQLPKTYNYIMNVLNATVLKGLTKVGDNTYPNMVPFLTGMRAYKKKGLPGPSWGDRGSGKGYFDTLPLVWKNFSKEGYITMLGEDDPEFATFNYLAKGFKFRPTDYYMRPFWLAMENIKHFKSSDWRCYGNKPKHMYFFDYTKEFVTKMKDYKYFAYSFLSDASHDKINSIKVIDRDIHHMLRDMYERESLKNTIVIVMGDHGNRFDVIRRTVIGRVEERMPFFSISLPQWMRNEYPHLEVGLKKNEKVLLSWYDLYELLMDVAMFNFGVESEVVRWGWIGLSPFRPITRNRTCHEIGISDEYCVCTEEIPMPPENEHAQEAAHDLISHVNGILAPVRAFCVPLMLVRVVDAQMLLPNTQVTSPDGFTAKLRVIVEVTPGGGLLEGFLERTAWSSQYEVVGDVNRINKYGNQSHCVEDRILKLYCFCSDLPTNRIDI